MAPEDRDPAPSSEPTDREGPAELSGTELAGLWSRKRSIRGPRRDRPDASPDEPAPPAA